MEKISKTSECQSNIQLAGLDIRSLHQIEILEMLVRNVHILHHCISRAPTLLHIIVKEGGCTI